MNRTINHNGKTILVTGSPGFIGANLVLRLLCELDDGHVISLDNMNDYYDPALKVYRLSLIEKAAKLSSVEHTFVRGNMADKALVNRVFEEYKPSIVVNLAAQAGVRYSIDHPEVYIESNIIGFFNILEACRHSYDNEQIGVEHLIYASSSSVYGSNKKIPFSTNDKVDSPVSLYAATKKSNELLAHAYCKLYNIPSTGLRFFTVYGPGGRPDMLYYMTTQKFVLGETIELFNYGDMYRDFTYIDDAVECIFRVIEGTPKKIIENDGLHEAPYSVYNIGRGTPENIMKFLSILQEELIGSGVLPKSFDFEEHCEYVGTQAGEVLMTYADSQDFERDFGYRPDTGLREGLREFASWYKKYYG